MGTHSESWRPPPTRILSRHLHRHHHLSNSHTSRHKTPKQPPCLRRRPPARLPARALTSPPAARERRTPTCRSAVCPPTCSSPTTSVTRFARRTLVSSSAGSARSLVRSGRASTTSRRLPTRPRLPLTRSVTRRRRQPTLLVARTRTRCRPSADLDYFQPKKQEITHTDKRLHCYSATRPRYELESAQTSFTTTTATIPDCKISFTC